MRQKGLKDGGISRYKKYAGQMMALLCVLVILCCFAVQKEGYHMDELLSFELANAEFNPWIVPNQPVGRLAKFVKEEIRGTSLGETWSNLLSTVQDVAVNRGESKLLRYKADVYPEPVWIGAEQFHEYLTVGAEDAFNYLSVYFNVKDDNHPPLHFMLLHTMSSVFRERISPFLGCFLNILAVLGCCLCFLALGTLLERHGIVPAGYGRMGGICASLLYGASTGAIATALLIRMYGLMTFFCVALFYLHVRKWLEKGFEKRNGRLLAVTVLGFLTQYFFLFFCLALAAATVGLLAARKRYRELKVYIRTMILSAILGLAAFPFAIQDVLASGRGVEALQNLGQGFSGYWVRLASFGAMLVKGSFGSLPLGIAALVLLAIALLAARRKRRGTAVGQTERADAASHGESRALLILLLVPCTCYFLLAARMSPYLVDRYIMPLFAFSAVCLTLLLGKLFSALPVPKRGFLLLPVLVLGVINLVTYDGEYLYKGYQEQLAIAEQYRELPCICLYEGVGYYDNLMEFTQYRETLLLTLPQLEERQDTSGWEQASQIIVLKKRGLEEESVLEAFETYGWQVEAELLSEEESVHGDTVYLCNILKFF